MNKQIKKEWSPFALLLILAFFTFAVDILIFPASKLNQDVFYYIALGSKSILCVQSKIQDAFTVGVVLPQFFKIMGLIASNINEEKLFQFEVMASKLLVVICYTCVLLITILDSIQKKRLGSAALLLSMTFIWMGVDYDIASLNGEILSVAIIIALKYYLEAYEKIRVHENFKKIFILILMVLVANTKIQSLPLGFLILWLYGGNRKNAFLALAILSIFLFDLWLYANETGFAQKLNNILLYLGNGNTTNDGSILQRMVSFKELLNISIKSYPLLIIMIVDMTLNKIRGTDGIENLDKLFLVLALTIITICIPGRTFKHYTIYMLVPLVIYIESVDFKFSVDRINLVMCGIFIVYGYSLNAFKFRIDEWRLNKHQSYNISQFGFDDLRRKIPRKSKVYINGWDYSLYTRLGICLPDDDFASMYGKQREKSSFYRDVLSGNYSYIIDVVGESGLKVDDSYKLNRQEVYNTVKNKYSVEKIRNSSIVLYRTK